ncbi:hypothetical protein IWZ03DRAFT_418293 [Phyllosticta citriasiana]|uniref:Uncharacterized protein n=1 Tax=Phyllosticta citriasiana TaxID=595635 RepID=A0ABR1KBD0_9PEZI
MAFDEALNVKGGKSTKAWEIKRRMVRHPNVTIISTPVLNYPHYGYGLTSFLERQDLWEQFGLTEREDNPFDFPEDSLEAMWQCRAGNLTGVLELDEWKRLGSARQHAPQDVRPMPYRKEGATLLGFDPTGLKAGALITRVLKEGPKLQYLIYDCASKRFLLRRKMIIWARGLEAMAYYAHLSDEDQAKTYVVCLQSSTRDPRQLQAIYRIGKMGKQREQQSSPFRVYESLDFNQFMYNINKNFPSIFAGINSSVSTEETGENSDGVQVVLSDSEISRQIMFAQLVETVFSSSPDQLREFEDSDGTDDSDSDSSDSSSSKNPSLKDKISDSSRSDSGSQESDGSNDSNDDRRPDNVNVKMQRKEELLGEFDSHRDRYCEERRKCEKADTAMTIDMCAVMIEGFEDSFQEYLVEYNSPFDKDDLDLPHTKKSDEW